MENNNQILQKDHLPSQPTASDHDAGTELGGNTGTATVASRGPVGALETAQPGTPETDFGEFEQAFNRLKGEHEEALKLLRIRDSNARDFSITSLKARQALEQTLEVRNALFRRPRQ